MSCRHACTCGGFCPGCSSREPERYFGEAEDLLSKQLGYESYEDHMSSNRREQEQEDTRQQECQEEQQTNSQELI